MLVQRKLKTFTYQFFPITVSHLRELTVEFEDDHAKVLPSVQVEEFGL
jgi:hypothetical protein